MPRKVRTLTGMQEFAKSLGGDCISDIYVNAKSPLSWVCSEGHVFTCTWDSIFSKGQWCSTCKGSVSSGELACQAALEQLLGVRFSKTRSLDFLRNRKHNKMEIDSYSSVLRLGVEFDGSYHTQVVSFFGLTSKDLAQRQFDDRLKDRLCAENGVTLLRVSAEAPLQQIPYDIEYQLKDLGYDLLCSAEAVSLWAVYNSGKFSTAELFSAFNKCVDLYGHLPSHREWDEFAAVSDYPSRSKILKLFGSFSAFVMLAGHVPRELSGGIPFTKMEVLDCLCKYMQEIGPLPSAHAWADHVRLTSDPSTGVCSRLLGNGSWVAAKDGAVEYMPTYLTNLGKEQTSANAAYLLVPTCSEPQHKDEELFGFLQGYIDTHGSVPTYPEWWEYARSRGYPSRFVLGQRFGSWTRFIRLAGHVPKRGKNYQADTDAQWLDLLYEYVKARGQLPSAPAWRIYAKEKGLPSVTTYRRRFGSWAKILEIVKARLIKHNINYTVKSTNLYTKSEMLVHFCEYAKIFGRLPSASGWKIYVRGADVPAVNTYICYFGSWAAAKREAYSILSEQGAEDYVYQSNRACTDTQLKVSLCRYMLEFGKAPTTAAWISYSKKNKAPSLSMFLRYLGNGSWTAAKQAAQAYMPTYLANLEKEATKDQTQDQTQDQTTPIISK